MMMLSVVHGFRSRINGNAEVSATGPTSRMNVASSASSGHLGATVPSPRSFLGLAPPLLTCRAVSTCARTRLALIVGWMDLYILVVL